MIVNLPFELGQKVWTLSDENKAIEFIIRDITVSISETECCNYRNYYNAPVYERNLISRKENELFATREELMKSIFRDTDID